MRARLPEGEIEAQHQKAAVSEGARHGREKLRLAIRSGAVRQRQGVAIRACRLVQKAAHGRLSRKIGIFLK